MSIVVGERVNLYSLYFCVSGMKSSFAIWERVNSSLPKKIKLWSVSLGDLPVNNHQEMNKLAHRSHSGTTCLETALWLGKKQMKQE